MSVTIEKVLKDETMGIALKRRGAKRKCVVNVCVHVLQLSFYVLWRRRPATEASSSQILIKSTLKHGNIYK